MVTVGTAAQHSVPWATFSWRHHT